MPGFSSAGYFLGFPPPALPFAAAGFAFLMPLDGGASTWFGSQLTLWHPLSSTRGLHPSSVRTEVPYCANRAPRWPTDHFETSCLGEWHYCRDILPGHRRSVCWRESVRGAARRRGTFFFVTVDAPKNDSSRPCVDWPFVFLSFSIALSTYGRRVSAPQSNGYGAARKPRTVLKVRV